MSGSIASSSTHLNAQPPAQNGSGGTAAPEKSEIQTAVEGLAKNYHTVWHGVRTKNSDHTHRINSFTNSAVARFNQHMAPVVQSALDIYKSTIAQSDTTVFLTRNDKLLGKHPHIETVFNAIAGEIDDYVGDAPSANNSDSTRSFENFKVLREVVDAVLSPPPNGGGATLLDNLVQAHAANARFSQTNDGDSTEKANQTHHRSTLTAERRKYEKNPILRKLLGQSMAGMNSNLRLNQAMSEAVRLYVTTKREDINKLIQEKMTVLKGPNQLNSDMQGALKELGTLGKLLFVAATPKEIRENRKDFEFILKLSEADQSNNGAISIQGLVQKIESERKNSQQKSTDGGDTTTTAIPPTEVQSRIIGAMEAVTGATNNETDVSRDLLAYFKNEVAPETKGRDSSFNARRADHWDVERLSSRPIQHQVYYSLPFRAATLGLPYIVFPVVKGLLTELKKLTETEQQARNRSAQEWEKAGGANMGR